MPCSQLSLPFCAASFYPMRLDDPKAVYLTHEAFGVRGDGQSDDSGAIQAAIDRVQESTGEGIVFVPEGRYRVTRTIYVWPGIRVIGYGATRPVMVLGDNTPGFQEGIGDMFFFAGTGLARRRVQASRITGRRRRRERFLQIRRLPMRIRARFIQR